MILFQFGGGGGGGCWKSAVTLEWSRGKTSSSCRGERALPVEKRAQVGFGDPRKAVQLGKGCQSWLMGLGAGGRGIRREEDRPNVS